MFHSWIGRSVALLASSTLLSGNAPAGEPRGDWNSIDGPNPSVVNRVLHIAGNRPNDRIVLVSGAFPAFAQPGFRLRAPMPWGDNIGEVTFLSAEHWFAHGATAGQVITVPP